MNFYVLYNVVSMFVNDVMCDQDIVCSAVLRLLGRSLFVDLINKELYWLRY